ncbi:MAG: hypothetical protein K0R57_1690 [Paenibacillaceae bacterium]|jgi:hypothetical protein|nr:hypothetical protein [Paenibacillaceae bacterium]
MKRAEEQAKVREGYSKAVAVNAMLFFDNQGSWLVPGGRPGLREFIWYAMACLRHGGGEENRLAQAIIRGADYQMCHFTPMSVLQLLVKYGDFLTDRSRQRLEGYLEEVLPEFAKPALDFVGVNDNFPCMAAFTAIIGGERSGDSRLAAIGEERLDRLCAMLRRRGFASEFTSPTYTPVQLCALAELANLTASLQVRAKALAAEARIWADIMLHYHPRLSNIAGPYSRAYTVDSAGQMHQAHYVLHAVLGSRLPLHPGDVLFGGKAEEGQIIHQNLAFMQVGASWMVEPDYHCPGYLIEYALNKTFPCCVSGTYEVGSSTDEPVSEGLPDAAADLAWTEYPAVAGTSRTVMTEEFALGVARHAFHSGNQTDSFHLLYSKTGEAVSSLAHTGAVYARYLVNGGAPEQLRDSYIVNDEGRKLGLLADTTAMMLYKPKDHTTVHVASLELCVIFPAGFHPVEELWLGDRRLAELEGESLEPCPVFIKDGPVYLCLHPLLLTDHGRSVAVRVKRRQDYLAVSFINYEGPPRAFSRRSLLLTGNGFVAETGTGRERGSFSQFRREALSASISDGLLSTPHNRQTFTRRVSYEKGQVRLYCEYSPASEGIKALEENGRTDRLMPLQGTGFPLERLPLFE